MESQAAETRTKRIRERAERLLKSCIKQGYGQENAARIAFEISERFEAEAYARIKAAEASNQSKKPT